MNKISVTLEELGLTKNEVKILTYLLHEGVKPGNEIYTHLNIEKSSAYKAIRSLESKELVISSETERNRFYKATTVENIYKLFDEKKEKIANAKDSFKNLLANFEQYSNNNYFNENISIFSGENAYENYHKELLKHSIKSISSFADSKTEFKLAGSKQDYLETNNWFIPERIAKNISIRVLYDSNAEIDESNLTNKKLLKECRQFEGTLNMDCVFSVFGDSVGFTTIKNGIFWALVVKDPLISSALLSIYDVIWNLSKIK